MADKQDATTTPTAAEQQPAPAADGQQTTQPTATFTQADIDRIVKDRIERERAKFADHETLKAAKAELDALKAAQMSEDEKRAARITELEQLAVVAQHERDEALKTANNRLIRSAFIAEAAKAGAEHPEDAYRLADTDTVTISEAGEVSGVAEAVAALVKAGRLPMRKVQGLAPNLDGGAAGATGSTLPVLTEEQERIAKRFGVKPEVYAQRLAETNKLRR